MHHSPSTSSYYNNKAQSLKFTQLHFLWDHSQLTHTNSTTVFRIDPLTLEFKVQQLLTAMPSPCFYSSKVIPQTLSPLKSKQTQYLQCLSNLIIFLRSMAKRRRIWMLKFLLIWFKVSQNRFRWYYDDRMDKISRIHRFSFLQVLLITESLPKLIQAIIRGVSAVD